MDSGILTAIAAAKPEEIPALLDAVLMRYRKLYSDWEISIISIEKGKDREAQLDRAIVLLEGMKKLP